MIATAEIRPKSPLVLAMSPSELDRKAVAALAAGEAMVLHVHGFVDASTCTELAARAQGYGYSSYLNVPSVRRIGMAFYETEGKQELVDTYFTLARQNVMDFRRACSPFGSPIDVLRCTLDEIWPRGAQLQSLGHRKMFIGLSRMVQPDTTFLAHHDIFSEDAPGHVEATGLLAQFAANVYIQMPTEGGALLMWRREMSPAMFNKMRGNEYGISIDRLGTPDLTVTPAAGDLLIFNSRKLHAVSSGTGQSRLALSCFIGYRGSAEPLTYWS